jgi:hypothetical protein
MHQIYLSYIEVMTIEFSFDTHAITSNDYFNKVFGRLQIHIVNAIILRSRLHKAQESI